MTWIITRPDRTFEPLDGLEPGAVHALVEPVENDDGAIIDTVAWVPDVPRLWWLQTGRGVLLGAPEILRSGWCGAPVTLAETPSRWVYYHSRGVHLVACIVRWDGDIASALSPAWQVSPESERLDRRLREALRDQWRAPAWLGARHVA